MARTDLSQLPDHLQVAFCGALLAMGAADGHLSDSEKNLIRKLVRETGMSSKLVEDLDRLIEQDPKLDECVRLLQGAPNVVQAACLEQLSEVAGRDDGVVGGERAALALAKSKLEPSSGVPPAGGIPKHVKVAAWSGLSFVAVMLATPALAMLAFGGVGGAAIMATLAWLGSFLGGGAVMGLAVLMGSGAAGGGVAAAITAAIADKVITDPDQLRVANMVRDLNELLDKAGAVAKKHEAKIKRLNDEYGQLLKASFNDQQRMSDLEANVAALLEVLHEPTPHA